MINNYVFAVDYPDYSNYNENDDYEETAVKFEKEEQDRILNQIHNDEQEEMGQEHNGSNYEYETEQDY